MSIVAAKRHPLGIAYLARTDRWLPGRGDATVDLLWVALALALVRGIIYALLNPPFGSPDERDHVQYVRYLATGQGERGAEGHQPVPYYLLMVPAYLLAAGGGREMEDLAIRLASVPFLMGVVLFTWLAARRMAPGRPLVAVVATALVALHPQLAYIGASANNDNAANLMAAVLTYLMVMLLSADTPRWVVPATAVALGAALMTKGQILPVAAAAAAALLWRTGSVGVRHHGWLGPCVACGLAAAALVMRTPSGDLMLARAQAAIGVLLDQQARGFGARVTLPGAIWYQFASFWAAFLGESVRPATPWYALPAGVLAASVVAGVGSCVRHAAAGRLPLPGSDLACYAALLWVVLAEWSIPHVIFGQVMRDDPANPWILQQLQGRYALGSAAAIALMVGRAASAGGPREPVRGPAIALLALGAFDLASAAALVWWRGWQLPQ